MRPIETPGQPTADSAGVARAAARLLETGKLVDLASTLTTLAVLVLAIVWGLGHLAPAHLMWTLVVILVLGLAQKYYALRVAFDVGLFGDLAEAFQQASSNPDKSSPDNAPLVELDRALAALGLRNVPEASPRPLSVRVAGATRLLRLQIVCLIIQWLLLVAASAVPAWIT